MAPPTTGSATAATTEINATDRTMSMRAAPRALLPATGLLWLRRRHEQHRLELQEALLADALHVHQLLHLLERAVLLAILQDELRRLAADAGQRLELLHGGGVEVDGGRRDDDRLGGRLVLRLGGGGHGEQRS